MDVNVKDAEGRTLLHQACDRGHKELVTVLLQYGADINCQDNEGQTALHYAAACEFLDIVELLLQSGANPTLRDQDGCLPEEVTVQRSYFDVTAAHDRQGLIKRLENYSRQQHRAPVVKENCKNDTSFVVHLWYMLANEISCEELEF